MIDNSDTDNLLIYHLNPNVILNLREANAVLQARLDAMTANRDEWMERAELFREQVVDASDLMSVPDSNCSCHISPPCNDCVEYGGIREYLSTVRHSLSIPMPRKEESWLTPY